MPLYTARKTRSRSLQRGCWRPSKRRVSWHGHRLSCRQPADCSYGSTRTRNGFVSIFENWYILSSCEVCGYGCVVVSCVFATLCSECSCCSVYWLTAVYRLYMAVNPVGARFSAPVQTGPEAHTASCTMGTGSLPAVRCCLGVTLTPHPLLVQRSKIE